MKEELYEDLTLDKEEQTDFRALFFKYFIHWPWFVYNPQIEKCGGAKRNVRCWRYVFKTKRSVF